MASPLSISSCTLRLAESCFFFGEKYKSTKLANKKNKFKPMIIDQEISSIRLASNAIERINKQISNRFVGKMPLSRNRNRSHKFFNDFVNGDSLQFCMWR